MLRQREIRCAACWAPMDARPTCRHCGEPRVENARELEVGRGPSILLGALGAVAGCGVALLTAATVVEGWPGAADAAATARLLSISLPLCLALFGPSAHATFGWLRRLVTTSRPPRGTPLRATPRAGLADGDEVTVRGRVKVRRAPLEGRPHAGAAAHGARAVSGAFSIVLDDGSEILVDDTDVVLGSRRLRDWAADAVELCEGDEVVASGPLRILAGGPAGYRDADRTLAFDGAATAPVRLVKLAASGGPHREPRALVPAPVSAGYPVPRVRVVELRSPEPGGVCDAESDEPVAQARVARHAR